MLCRVTASILPQTVDDVVDALGDVGICEFTVTESRGFSRRAERRTYRGAGYAVLAPKVVVDVVVPVSYAVMVGDLIAANAHTGSLNDGAVWFSSIDRALDIRTGSYDIEPS